ncbi:hypothetical protein CRU96_05975 [Malaciobacter halophilus]|nr:DCC1-like thiol-disulfide oxidoreductase family protein [Malaciobacter halophilus]RYA23785.1 hypothetical protein CRU96_05975 [Malaciobacter halophilus]
MKDIKLYYDKDCPFCSKYATFLKLKENHKLTIYNARDNKELMNDFYKKGFDINRGFIILIDDLVLIQGSDALAYLDNIAKNRLFIFRSSKLMFLIYPIFKFLRKIILFLLRKNTNIIS